MCEPNNIIGPQKNRVPTEGILVFFDVLGGTLVIA